MPATPFMVLGAGNKRSTTLSSSVTASALTMTLSSVAGLNPNGGYLILDRGTVSEEIIYYESISGSTITIATDGRGRCGTTAVAHSSGATVNDVIVDEHINRPRSAFLAQHLDNGEHNLAAASFIDKLVDSDGGVLNGRVNATVSSGNLTVSIVRPDGSSATSSSPIYVKINGLVRQVTSALSVTINGGLDNWGQIASGLRPASGSNRIDLFVWAIWNSTTSQVQIGVSRVYRFNVNFYTSTPADVFYLATNASFPPTGSTMEVVGRITAHINSAGSFTSVDSHIYNGRIDNTLHREYNPTVTGSGAMTVSNVVKNFAWYQITNNIITVGVSYSFDLGGTASDHIRITLPLPAWNYPATSRFTGSGYGLVSSGNITVQPIIVPSISYNILAIYRSDFANFVLGAGRGVHATITYPYSL